MELASTTCSGYWGAARDRIPLASDDLFEPTVAAAEPAFAPSARAIIRPPGNMAVIRSGVSWEDCEGEQLDDYQERIRPKLDAGMIFLRDHPRETGCFSLRQVECISPEGQPLREGYSLGAFVSISHLEAWARDHPTHLAIYMRAMAARRKYQEKLQLRTYNEIFIIEAGNPPFEYVNCHPKTGLLPYTTRLDHESPAEHLL
jgi:aldoxime dehydratase